MLAALRRKFTSPDTPAGPSGPGTDGLRVFRVCWIIFMAAATALPYVLNWLATPHGYHYTWIMPPYPEDAFGYMAWSQQAACGSLLFRLKYTALPHSAFLFHPLFLLCGWASALSGCGIGITHLAVKTAGVALFFLAFYRYSDYLGLDGRTSAAASVLAGVSSGFGGLLAALGLAGRLHTASADLWLVDANTYWSLLWNPLFPYSLTLMLLAVYWADRGTREGRKADLWYSGLSTGVLALLHPYSQPLLFAFTTLLAAVRRKAGAWGYLLRFALAALPFLLYVGLITEFHPLVARHSFMGAMKSPSPAAHILGFGFPLLFAAAGLAVNRGGWAKRYWQVIAWFAIAAALAYFPVWFQRKLIFGAHVPLCLLAALALEPFLGRSAGPRLRRPVLAAALVLLPLLAATPVFLVVSECREAQSNAGGVYFISGEVRDGFNFLKRTSSPEEVVLASYPVSSLIPAFTGNTAVWGHWAQSVDGEERKAWISGLFSKHADFDDPGRAQAFWGTGINYILGLLRFEWVNHRG